MSDTEYEGKVSTFNEAALKMVRLDNLQTAMNQFRINPFIRLHSEHQFDFELWAACLDGLYLEVSSKLSDKEDEKIMKLLNTAREEMATLLKIRDTSLWGAQIHRIKMSNIRIALFNAEKTIRRMLDEHGLGSPNTPEEGGYD